MSRNNIASCFVVSYKSSLVPGYLAVLDQIKMILLNIFKSYFKNNTLKSLSRVKKMIFWKIEI